MTVFHKVARVAENWIDGLSPAGSGDEITIAPYVGYSRDDTVILRGRLLAVTPLSGVKNFLARRGTVAARAMSFFTNDAEGIEIRCGDQTTHSDEEGYFRLEVPTTAVENGKVTVSLPKIGITCDLNVALTSPSATRAVISDIDDTIIKTGAWQKARNFWVTMTSDASEREIFKDTVELIRNRVDGGNPVFYVSSSPWNLHSYLREIFEAGDVPFGPMFLKDFGIDKDKFIKGSHGSHKGGLIDELVEANPGLAFTLIGDTGQHDGQIYLDAVKRHPDRIVEIFLRQAGTPDDDDRRIAEAIQATGVSFHSAERFDDCS